MRTLGIFTFPVEASNKAVQDGSLAKIMEKGLADLKPEAAYFYPHGGKRSALIVFDLKDPSDIPAIAEPFFMGMNASVQFFPVMNADDLRAGLEKAAKNR